MPGAVLQLFPLPGDKPVALDVNVPELVRDEMFLLTVDEVARKSLAGMLTAPIEEWKAFLGPDRDKLVRRGFSGPA